MLGTPLEPLLRHRLYPLPRLQILEEGWLQVLVQFFDSRLT